MSDETISMVVEKLENKKQVENAKIFPIQYYSAIHSISIWRSKFSSDSDSDSDSDKVNAQSDKVKVESDKVKAQSKLPNLSQVESLKDALDKALKISIDNNIDELKGLTYIFCDVSGSMKCPISGGKKYGSVRECYELSLLLGIMLKQKC